MAKNQNIGFAGNYTHLHLIRDIATGKTYYVGPGISSFENDNEDETDDTSYLDGGGAKSNYVTGVTLKDKFAGHRYYGDPAQDFVASKATAIGEDRIVDYIHISPDGSALEAPATIGEIVLDGGDANAKGTFEFSLTYNEMPTATPPQSTAMPESISFEEPLEIKAGESLNLAEKIKVTPEGATPNAVFSLDNESMDKELAMVDAAGILQAKAEGTVRVTAKCVSKPSATATAEITIGGSEAV